jgi:hypothetical protein
VSQGGDDSPRRDSRLGRPAHARHCAVKSCGCDAAPGACGPRKQRFTPTTGSCGPRTGHFAPRRERGFAGRGRGAAGRRTSLFWPRTLSFGHDWAWDRFKPPSRNGLNKKPRIPGSPLRALGREKWEAGGRQGGTHSGRWRRPIASCGTRRRRIGIVWRGLRFDAASVPSRRWLVGWRSLRVAQPE